MCVGQFRTGDLQAVPWAVRSSFCACSVPATVPTLSHPVSPHHLPCLRSSVAARCASRRAPGMSSPSARMAAWPRWTGGFLCILLLHAVHTTSSCCAYYFFIPVHTTSSCVYTSSSCCAYYFCMLCIILLHAVHTTSACCAYHFYILCILLLYAVHTTSPCCAGFHTEQTYCLLLTTYYSLLTTY